MSWDKFDAERGKTGRNQSNKGAAARHGHQATRIQAHRAMAPAGLKSKMTMDERHAFMKAQEARSESEARGWAIRRASYKNQA